jgi:hypothetical protein
VQGTRRFDCKIDCAIDYANAGKSATLGTLSNNGKKVLRTWRAEFQRCATAIERFYFAANFQFD